MADMIFVDSTSIEAIGYDAATSELYVQFKKGETYVIAEVPLEAYDEFLNSSSKGSHYNRCIKPIYQNVRRL